MKTKNADVNAVEKIQQIMTNDFWLLSHADLDFNVVIRQQKNWSALMAAIKKAARTELGGAIRFVGVEMMMSKMGPNSIDAIFKIVLMLKHKPITFMLSVVRIYG